MTPERMIRAYMRAHDHAASAAWAAERQSQPDEARALLLEAQRISGVCKALVAFT